MVDHWQQQPPAMAGGRVTLRQVRTSDAASLLHYLSAEEVCLYIPPPPPTVEAFGAFIADAHRRRRDGRGCTFAVVPANTDEAVGLIQLLALNGEAG
jgi:RimJ/RimL family protein N-acetyltransferase